MFDLSGDDIARLRDRLRRLDYTVEGVQALLGPVAHAALDRNETAPGRIELRHADEPLATLVRLWTLQQPVPDRSLAVALPGLVEPLAEAGLLRRAGGEVVAAVDVRPYGDEDHDWWVVADPTPGLDGVRSPVPADHVLGVNSAATTLGQLTVPRHASRALDLGTGCGIQALHLSSHTDHVVATDVNPRALAMARLTAGLNELDVDLRAGSFFEPVAGERFDLIVSNPPFVVSPGGAGGLAYRDSGLPGDEVCEMLLPAAVSHLAEGGVCQLLANWVHRRDQDWRDRVGGWLAGVPADAWVIQREVSDPAEYVEVWLKDAGLHGAPGYQERYEDWLRWFSDQQVDGVGFGWVTLRRTDAEPTVRLEDWPHPVAQPVAPAVAAWLETVRWLADRDTGHARAGAGLGSSRLRVRGDVESEQVGPPGAAHPERIVLRQRAGLCRARLVDTAEAGLVGGCDGTLTVDQIVAALAQLLDAEDDAMSALLVPRACDLLAEGFLEPVTGPES